MKKSFFFIASAAVSVHRYSLRVKGTGVPGTVVSVLFSFLTLSFFLVRLPSASIQLTTPPHCNFCVTRFTNTQKLKHTVGCKVGA